MNATKGGQSKADSPAPLPKSRAELLVLHGQLRHQRDTAALGSHERAAAMADIGRVEVEIARLERAMDPPLV